eukprot:7629230-Karenia_brevis.AAC.1
MEVVGNAAGACATHQSQQAISGAPEKIGNMFTAEVCGEAIRGGAGSGCRDHTDTHLAASDQHDKERQEMQGAPWHPTGRGIGEADPELPGQIQRA